MEDQSLLADCNIRYRNTLLFLRSGTLFDNALRIFKSSLTLQGNTVSMVLWFYSKL